MVRGPVSGRCSAALTRSNMVTMKVDKYVSFYYKKLGFVQFRLNTDVHYFNVMFREVCVEGRVEASNSSMFLFLRKS